MPYLQTRIGYATTIFQKAEYEEAKIVFGQLLKIYKKENDLVNMRLCLYRLACIAYIRGEIQRFHEIFIHYRACKLQEEELLQEAEYYMLQGLVKLSFQHYREAVKAFTHAAALAEEKGITEYKVMSLLYIQRCHILLGHSELSLEVSDELWTTCHKEIQLDASQFFHYLLNRADILYAFAQLDEMSELVEACETHEDLHTMPKEYAKTLLTRAKLHIAKQESRPAMLALKKAVEIAEEQEDINLRSEVYEMLIDQYERRGKTKQALRYAKKRLVLHKKILYQMPG